MSSHVGINLGLGAYLDRTAVRASLICHPQGENRGTSATRNLGLSHAKGIYRAGRWHGSRLIRAPYDRVARLAARLLLR